VTTAMLLCNGPLTVAADAQTFTQGGHTIQQRKTHLRKAVAPSENDQNIQVYGRWVIDVRNPDGTLAEHRAFENAISNSGDQLLVELLSGKVVSGAPSISATSAQGTPPCSGGCSISPSASVSVPTVQGIPVWTLVLSGQTTATQNGVIDSVSTLFINCRENPTSPSSTATNLSPAFCSNPSSNPSITYANILSNFTDATIFSLNVSAGQSIQISVSISFGSLG
jgi:hypothetical protein